MLSTHFVRVAPKTNSLNTNIVRLHRYIKQLKKYKLPIWISEFSCPQGPSNFDWNNQAAFMTKALDLLDADPMIKRHAWYSPIALPVDSWLGMQRDLSLEILRWSKAPRSFLLEALLQLI